MSEPPLIYAFHGVVLLQSATSIVLSRTHFSSLSSDKKQKKWQNIPQSSFYIVQAVGCILGTLI